jgi:hypothetical protein
LERDIAGGFQEHNQWSLSTKDFNWRCPLYLQLKYGKARNGNVMDGDPSASLIAFHEELQNEALIQLKKKTRNDALWRRTEIRKFGGRQLIKYPSWAEKIQKGERLPIHVIFISKVDHV